MRLIKAAGRLPRRALVGYAVAVLATILTTALAYLLIEPVARRYPFFTYYPATLVSAYLGGLGPGLLALVLSEIALWYVWLDPGVPQRARDVGALAVFFATGAALSWMMEALHRAQDRLRAALEREQAENAVKDVFLAGLSHELRTPLNVIMGRAQLLRTMWSDERLQQNVEVIERNASAQLRLVEDLLDSQRIVQERFELRRERVSLDQLAKAALDTVRLQVDDRRLQFTTRLDQVECWGDPARLEQIFHNLLGNALKFTERPGRIGLTVRRERGTAVIEVEDSGIGIAPDFLPYVFERFSQADQSYSRTHQQGLGLGLAIVKAIAEAHEGSVTAESAGPGHGARFTVRLPIRRGPVEGAEAEPLADAGL